MRFRKLLRDRRGTAVAELAFVLPILLIILFGMVILGVSINTKIAVSMAARESARYYAVNSNDVTVDSDTRQLARDRLRGGITASDSEFNKSFNPGSDVEITLSANGRYVTVKVTYHQSTMIPGLLSLVGGTGWGNSFALTSSATFKVE